MPQPPPKQSGSRRARTRRRRGLLGVAIIALLIALPLILTRTAAVKLLVLPKVGSLLGADVSASRVVIDPDATIVATDVVIRARGLDPPAADILRAERLEIRSSWGNLLTGSGNFSGMTLVRPRLRVSRDSESGAINLARLRIPVSDASPAAPLPHIVVRDGTIELGEHGPDDYAVLRTLRVEGSILPTPDPEHLGYAIAFSEGAVSDPLGRGLALTGRVAPDGITLTLEGLLLSEWRPQHIPAQYRSIFARMGIEGEIPRTAANIAPDGSMLLRVELDGVSLNLPFGAEGREADPDNPVRLKQVTGTIDVDDNGVDAILTGNLGDLPSVVRLKFHGLEVDAPFRCEIETTGFALSKHPEILPLAPDVVVRRLNDFSSPTATVDASVVVERAAPVAGAPAPIRVSGRVAFHNGTAAFHEFPYVFRNMDGLATFDDEKIDIIRITGVADSGAVVEASGTIAPPRSGAAVDIRVQVDGVPIDRALLDAIGEDRRKIVEALFSTEQYDRLLARGLVRRPGEPGEAPEFALGGKASVLVLVERPLGEHTEYTHTVHVKLPSAGVVAQPFPLPIVAKDVEIAIDGHTARVERGEFSGLSGGTAQIDAAVNLDAPDESAIDLSIRASGIPTDDLLLAAIPGGLDEEPDRYAPSAVLRRLGILGKIDCTADIAPRDSGALGYDIDVSFDGLDMRPEAVEASVGHAVVLSGARGRLHVTERDVALETTANITARDDPAAVPAGDLALEGRFDLVGDQRPFQAQVRARLPDLALRLDDLVAVVAPDMADKLAELRRDHSPAGAVTIRSHGEGVLGAETVISRLDVEVLECADLAFDTPDGRLQVTSNAGTLAFSAIDLDSVSFDGFEADVSLDDNPACAVKVSGSFPLSRPWSAGDELTLGLRGARLHSPLVRRIAAGALPPKLGEGMVQADLAGLFDADLHVVGEGPRDGEQTTPRVTGELRPLSCQLTIGGQRITMFAMRGGITLEETGGSLDAFRAEGDGWWAEIGGTWVAARRGAVLLDFIVSGASATGLRPEVRALLPSGLRDAIASVSIDAAGPVSAEAIKVSLSLDEKLGSAYSSSGRVVFEGAGAEAGVKIEDASGYLDFDAESLPGATLGSFGIGVVLDRATAAGIHLRDGAMRIASDPHSGMVMVPVLLADAYGGRLTGSVIVRLHEGAPATYEADLRLSGAPLGEILADWEHQAGIEHAASPDGSATQRESAESRGLVDAGLALAGVAGADGSRRGRGVIRIGGGPHTEVLRLPLLLPLIQVSNLQIPQNDRLDFGEAVFFLDGDRVVFERLGVLAESIEIFGYGQMDLPGMNLDLRFNSRAINRIPLVNELVERFRNELITTSVAGTVAEPQVSVVQFAGTRQLLAAASGRDPTPEERRMLEIERLSRESAQRERRVDRAGAIDSSPGD